MTTTPQKDTIFTEYDNGEITGLELISNLYANQEEEDALRLRRREYLRQYRIKNKEKIDEYREQEKNCPHKKAVQRQYYQENREKILAERKEAYKNKKNSERSPEWIAKQRTYQKEYYEKNKKRILKKRSEQSEEAKERKRARERENYATKKKKLEMSPEHIAKRKAYQKEYYKNNKEAFMEAQRKYRNKPEVKARITKQERSNYSKSDQDKNQLYYYKTRNYKSDNYSPAFWRIFQED